MPEHDRRRSDNEKLARRINETLDRSHQAGDEGDRFFVCECARRACAAPVRIPPGEYARVRSHPRRFVVVPGHEDGSIEFVVEARPSYAVVEKFGDAGEIAEAGRD